MVEEVNICAQCGSELVIHKFNDGDINEWEEEVCPKCSFN